MHHGREVRKLYEWVFVGPDVLVKLIHVFPYDNVMIWKGFHFYWPCVWGNRWILLITD